LLCFGSQARPMRLTEERLSWVQALARRDSGLHPSVVIAKRFPAELEKGLSEGRAFFISAA